MAKTKYGHTIYTDENGIQYVYGVTPSTKNIRYYDNDGDNRFTDKSSNKIITKKKQYQATPRGFISAMWDKITGNDTYQTTVNGTVKADNRTKVARKIDQTLQDNNNPVGYVYQTVAPLAEMVYAPYGAAKIGLGATVRTIAPAALGGYFSDVAADKLSQLITGKTVKQNLQPYYGDILSDKITPGTLYGTKLAVNFKNLGRFTMNYVYPASYEGHGLYDFGKAIGMAFLPFSKIPHFNNRLPKSFQKHEDYFGDDALRLENMAEWAGVNEIPRKHIFKRDDGTYGFFDTKRYPGVLSDDDHEIGRMRRYQDQVFGVGGEHSDFTLLDKRVDPQGGTWKIWEYQDEQKLNPQWRWADKIKKKFGVDDESLELMDPETRAKAEQSWKKKIPDFFGKRDVKWMVGFDNDIKYKQNLLELPNGDIQLFENIQP